MMKGNLLMTQVGTLKRAKKDKDLFLRKKAQWVRKKTLEMAVKAGVGHIAPAFSCIDILVCLYQGGFLRVKPRMPNWQYRDRFILSKGQAAIGFYPVLADMGYIDMKELMTFCQRGSSLGGHPEDSIPGVEAFTGSLGHGLPIAAGIALSAKLGQKKYRAVTLMGDGECHEGSVWEAAMFAGHHRLNNLIAIIDNNGLSATDYLEKYLTVSSLEKKWESFGWDVVTVHGNVMKELRRVFAGISQRQSDRPLVIIALTTKGKGVSFMENKPIWHFRVPAGKELIQARKELSIPVV
jgi:transketolase